MVINQSRKLTIMVSVSVSEVIVSHRMRGLNNDITYNWTIWELDTPSY